MLERLKEISKRLELIQAEIKSMIKDQTPPKDLVGSRDLYIRTAATIRQEAGLEYDVQGEETGIYFYEGHICIMGIKIESGVWKDFTFRQHGIHGHPAHDKILKALASSMGFPYKK